MADGLTLAFVGHARADMVAKAAAFEDEVLALLPDHGGKLLFRGQRMAHEPQAKPAEVHLIWFPDTAALNSYLNDPRRAELVATHGEVFTSKEVTALNPLAE